MIAPCHLRPILALLTLLAPVACALAPQSGSPPSEPLLGQPRQLTFDGRRSGEGYFGAGSQRIVFQSEREPGNPFYQIYLLELETGGIRRISPGRGKTTCAWLHPDGERVLFASTYHDPRSAELQKEELELRASGEERRYAWDYDEHYELYAGSASGGEPVRLTRARGYDAEGSYSPDGEWIAFTSNRHAYAGELDPEAAARFAHDPSVEMDLYLMRADGSDVRRLTHSAGYDGGPFFSPDGKRIVWRRFSLDGATAEIYTMATDGSDVRQLTRLGAMSWAPFYHPSGEYVVFSTNLHGFGNFELYAVDTAGAGEPLRVTDSPGFDGLPAFAPNGQTLAWTSGRTPDSSSQVFVAAWDHAGASDHFGGANPLAEPIRSPADPGPIAESELRVHVDALASPALGGRATGSEGGRLATEYVAGVFAELGLEPAGDDGYFQSFEFTAGVSQGAGNALTVVAGGRSTAFDVEEHWRPLAFSQVGEAEPAPVVFAGYGIVAPEDSGQPAYDSYGDLEVRDRWVLVLRFVPEDATPERRQQLTHYAGLRYKAMLARERGARGLIVVTGPSARVHERLVPLTVDVALAGTSVFGLSADEEVAARMLAPSGRTLGELERELATGESMTGFELEGVEVGAHVDLVQERRAGRNVLGRLSGSDAEAALVVVGAHVDHLGAGSGTSLAQGHRRQNVHPGADDNASGVAGLLEIARWLASAPERPKSDVVFAAWSGEEIGLLGSAHYVAALPAPDPHATHSDRAVAAYLNMDMIGRLGDTLVLHGLGSSPVWAGQIERANAPIGLAISAQRDSYLPTDTTPFYLKGIPVLSAFTGSHEDYHTPGDTPDKLNYPGTARTAQLMGTIAYALASDGGLPDYVAMARPSSGTSRARLRVYLGTIPDYARTDVVGVALSGVVTDGPADRAGVHSGDVIVELDGQGVENIYDYTYAMERLAVGEPAGLHVVRGGERIELEITPDSRD